MEERGPVSRAIRRVAFAVVFGLVAGALIHVLMSARWYYLRGDLFRATRPDGSRMGFIEYTVYHDPWLGIGTLVITFGIALWKGPGDWMEP